MAVGFVKQEAMLMDVASAPLFLGFIALMPKALTTCKIDGLTEAEVGSLMELTKLLHPIELGRNLTRNYFSHGAEISEYAHGITTNWDSAEFLAAGTSFGSLMATLLKPAESSEAYTEPLETLFLN